MGGEGKGWERGGTVKMEVGRVRTKAPFTQAIFVAQLDAIFVALCLASSFKHV